MIRITIELLPPFARVRRTIARAEVVNEGTGTAQRADYRYALWGKQGAVWRMGDIKAFPRKSYNIWRLLYYILREIFEK